MRLSLPEAHAVFGNNGPTARVRVAVLRDDRVSVRRVEFLKAKELAVSDVLECPKAASVLREHPLRYRDEVSCMGR